MAMNIQALDFKVEILIKSLGQEVTHYSKTPKYTANLGFDTDKSITLHRIFVAEKLST